MTMMMINRLCCLLLLVASVKVYAFIPAPTLSTSVHPNAAATTVPRKSTSRLFTSSTDEKRRMGELTGPETQVFDILDSVHASGYKFRLVVVGKGAILETTAALGPVLKVTQSPSTGTNLLTMANEDQSFEFHLQLSQVLKIVLTEKEAPKKTLRIIRLLNVAGDSLSSLILADESEAALAWYKELIAKYGKEIVM